MQKVVFSVTNFNNKQDKISGFGFLVDGNLLCPTISKKNKPYIKVLENAEDACHKVAKTTDEFSGILTQYLTDIPVTKNGAVELIDLGTN